MAEQNQIKQAKAVFKTLCDMLDDKKWHYDKDENNLRIECGVQGDDLPMNIRMEVDAERMLVVLYSQMPFKVAEDRRSALAVAVSVANYGMVDGSFDYNYLNGNIVFRLTSSYRDSLIGKEMLAYMLACSCHTVDEYNDKFLMVAKSNMSYDEILKVIN